MADLVSQGRNTGDRMRAKAKALVEPGFMNMDVGRKRTQPGDAQQVNAMEVNKRGDSGAKPTPYAQGGSVRRFAEGGNVKGEAAFDDKGAKQPPVTLKKGGAAKAKAKKAPPKLPPQMPPDMGAAPPMAGPSMGAPPPMAGPGGPPPAFKKGGSLRRFAEGGSSSGGKQGKDDGSPPPPAPDRKGQKWLTGGEGKDPATAKAILDDARAKGQLDMKRGGVARFAVGGVAKTRRGVADKSGHAIAQPTKTSPAWK